MLKHMNIDLNTVSLKASDCTQYTIWFLFMFNLILKFKKVVNLYGQGYVK
jgi:hypothetical protein